MLKDILFALWFFLPAGLANAAPVFANKIPKSERLALPLDFGKHLRGKRIFGEHKTLRGLLAGIVVAEVTIVLQRIAYEHNGFFKTISLHINYSSINIFYLGLLFAVGALGFDALKSFFKRQLGVKPGGTWFPFDQIDYIIGGLLLASIVVDLPHNNYYWIGLIWFLIHPVSTFFAWLMGLKDSPL
jgi:CDP-2,3-bis-(O-geranylgeranyl)-sn-glycerol synthase